MSVKQKIYKAKAILVGTTNVGKTTLFNCATNEDAGIGRYKPTINVACATMTRKVKDDTLEITLWDTAGQEQFNAITESYLRNADVIIAVLDVSAYSSLAEAERWLKKSIEANDHHIALILVVNISDLEISREVPYNEALEKANDLECAYIETSAKTHAGIDALFQEIANDAFETAKANGTIEDKAVEIDQKPGESNCQC